MKYPIKKLVPKRKRLSVYKKALALIEANETKNWVLGYAYYYPVFFGIW